jgi:predicted heme/steroid binding protein
MRVFIIPAMIALLFCGAGAIETQKKPEPISIGKPIAVAAVEKSSGTEPVGEKKIAAAQGEQKSEATNPQASAAKDSLLILTKEDLAKYNGKNGMPAYVAVDGVVYDVSGVKAWKNGRHEGNSAGSDLTLKIKKNSPHGMLVLKKLKVVGKLVEKG